jgi:hypothetical protein
MRAVPYGLGWSSLCVLVGLEVVCPCDSGRLFSISCYAWVLFLADKGEMFGFVWNLILRLKN